MLRGFLVKLYKIHTREQECKLSLPSKMGESFEAKATAPKANATGKSFLILPSPVTRKFSPTPPTPGQIVVLTNPEIGNYGTNPEDNEATHPYIEGLIVREFSKVSSNWRSQQVAEEYLEQFKIPVLADIDTRALVRHLRDHGVMRGVVSTIEMDPEKLVAKANAIPKMDGTDLAKVVSTDPSVCLGGRRDDRTSRWQWSA